MLGEGPIYLTSDPGAAAPQTVWLLVGFREMFCGVPSSPLSLVGGVQMVTMRMLWEVLLMI